MPVRLSAYDSATSANKKFTSTVQVIYEPMLTDAAPQGNAAKVSETYDVSLVFKDADVSYTGIASPGAPDVYAPAAGETNYQLTWRNVKIGKSSATLDAGLQCKADKKSTERWATLTAFATLPGAGKPSIEAAVERVAYVHICPSSK